MVPKIPSCHYLLLLQPSRPKCKFISNQLLIFVYMLNNHCHRVTAQLHLNNNNNNYYYYYYYCIVRVIKSRRMRWAGHVARIGEGRGVYSVLVGKPEGKRPLGRPRRRWEDNIRMDLHEVGCGCEDWIWLAQDRDRWRALVSAVRNLRVP
jgi:hypothetical protein